MILALLTPIDGGVVLLFVAATLVAAFYFRGRQSSATEFLLGSRSLDWLPVGLSLAAAMAGPLVFSLPAHSYENGLRCWVVPGSLWLILPLVIGLTIPIQRGLGLDSFAGYLERRFNRRVRLLAAWVYVICRLLWIAGWTGLACRAIVLAAGWNVPAWVILFPLVVVAAWCTILGGLRAIVWTGVVQAGVMLLGIAIVVGAILLASGGSAHVSELAGSLGRLRTAETGFRWTDAWTVWGGLPYWLLISAFFFTSDQMAVQRFLAAKDVNTARTSNLVQALGATFLLAGLIFAGLGLVAFYHDHPDQLRAEWVVNLDGSRREPISDRSGQPLLDPANPAHQITPQNLKRLVAERRVLRPNDKLPFTSADELLDPMTGRVLIEKLAMYRPGEQREVVLRRGASDELLPYFIESRLAWGGAGIALAALLAGALASLGAGLHAVATVLVVDFFSFRRPALSEIDTLRLARKLTIVVAGAVMAVSFVGLQGAEPNAALIALGSALAAPLLAVTLLGMLTRRATSAAAFLATLFGSLISLVLSVADRLVTAGIVSDRYWVSEIWIFIVAFALPFSLGYLLSFFVGSRKTKRGLRGLVLGCGRLGVTAQDEEVPIITDPAETAASRG
jgi:solute:Na+ symporter, SSS family